MLTRTICFVALLLPFTLRAQGGEKQDVLATVDRFFAALGQSDTTAIGQLMMPGSQFVLVEERQPRTVKMYPRDRYLRDIAKHPEDRLVERIWNIEVTVHDGLATVHAAYDFHVNGRFSHCGHDVFDLALLNGQWMITGGQFTMRVEGCPPSPLGPLK
ncbi:MAG: nuclear transport factor 2 family protein [Flavobacteriales bacterium]|nr:nuclear transport factor 2 family protein [Flavobacteriales bacterium]